eukprot:1137778-Pelagomonas_calceolata.AAC.1
MTTVPCGRTWQLAGPPGMEQDTRISRIGHDRYGSINHVHPYTYCICCKDNWACASDTCFTAIQELFMLHAQMNEHTKDVMKQATCQFARLVMKHPTCQFAYLVMKHATCQFAYLVMKHATCQYAFLVMKHATCQYALLVMKHATSQYAFLVNTH